MFNSTQKLLITALSLILLSFPILAADLAANFLSSEMGPRPLAMGSAFTAIADDSSGPFYNPAGIVGLRSVYATFKDFSNYGLGQSLSGDDLTFGISYLRQSSDQVTYLGQSTNFQNGTLFLSAATRLDTLFARGARPSEFLVGSSLGLNLKVTQLGLAGSANGVDADLGLILKPQKNLSFGVCLQNFLPDNTFGLGVLNWGSRSEPLPLNTKLGAAWTNKGEDEFFANPNLGKVLLSVDSELNTTGAPPLFRGGMEWWTDKNLVLRLGLDQDAVYRSGAYQVESSLSAGFGFRHENLEFAFAHHPTPYLGYGPTYFFSAAYLFGQRIPPELLEALRREVFALDRPLTIITPQDSLKTYDAFIDLVGSVDPAAALSVNGLPVFIEADGSFYAQVPVRVGKNLLEVRAVKKDFEERQHKRVLRKVKVLVVEEVKVEEEQKRIAQDLAKKDISLSQVEQNILEQDKKLKEAEEALRLARIENERKAALQAKERAEAEKVKISEQKKQIEEAKKKAQEKQLEIEARKKHIAERKAKVEELATLGVIMPQQAKEFEAEELITRAELAVWLVKARNLPLKEVTEDIALDVPRIDWTAPYIKTVVDLGLMPLYPDGKFRPSEGVSEAIGIEILRRFDELTMRR